MKTRFGALKAVTATAHKLARLVHRMLKFGTEHADRGPDYYERRYQRRVLSSLTRRPREFAYMLVKNEDLRPSADSRA